MDPQYPESLATRSQPVAGKNLRAQLSLSTICCWPAIKPDGGGRHTRGGWRFGRSGGGRLRMTVLSPSAPKRPISDQLAGKIRRRRLAVEEVVEL